MRTRTQDHMVAIEAKTAKDFQERMEEAFAKLSGQDLDITYNLNQGHCAYIHYCEEVQEPETLADEYHLQGIYLTCADCPELEKTDDKRRRYFNCKVRTMVRPMDGACERLYRMVEKGDVKL